MADPPLYPLRFEPIFQYRLWGGRRLADWLDVPLPGDGPIGEAWLLSDRDDNPSRVAHGPWAGHTIAQLMARAPESILGRYAHRFSRFPLLLKFLDVQKMLSVQVHPRDGQAALIPAGETGKTEAWIVLEARPEARVYAGLKAGTTEADLRALSMRTVDKVLASFAPHQGQAVLIEAGSVHAVGNGAVVFEVQENSDITFRLYDWDHIDPATGGKRQLQVDKALSCVDIAQVAICPTLPVIETTNPVQRERVVVCSHFSVWRLRGTAPFMVGATAEPRVLVCLDGNGFVEHSGARYQMAKGVVLLLPAILGVCNFQPGGSVELLELAVRRCIIP